MSRLSKLFLFLTFGLYCAIYPGSIFVLATKQVPEGTEWMASLMLFAMGLAAISWVMVNYGAKRGWLACLLVLLLAYGVETLGELTDFPFGSYDYSNVLAPKVGAVPIPITFAWLMIVLSSYFTARLVVRRIFPEFGSRMTIVLGVGLAIVSDLLMEPVAFHVQGYWVWNGGGFYYGVPLANFVAWIATTLVLLLILTRLTGIAVRSQKSGVRIKTPGLRLSVGNENKRSQFEFVPPALYMLNLIMFTAINLSYDFFLAAAIGAFAASFFGYVVISPYLPSLNPLRLILRSASLLRR